MSLRPHIKIGISLNEKFSFLRRAYFLHEYSDYQKSQSDSYKKSYKYVINDLIEKNKNFYNYENFILMVNYEFNGVSSIPFIKKLNTKIELNKDFIIFNLQREMEQISNIAWIEIFKEVEKTADPVYNAFSNWTEDGIWK